MSNEQPSLRATRTAASHDARTVTPDERAGALEFLQGLSKEMSAGKVNLPCFPDVVIRIRRALANPQTHIAQTVRIVGTEPRLAARLLQTANSVIFNQSGKPVSDLRTAVTRLGTRLVQSSAMAFAVQQMRMAPLLKSVGGELKELWEESISAATPAVRGHAKDVPLSVVWPLPVPGCAASMVPGALMSGFSML